MSIFSHTLYTLSDGSITKNKPYFFYEREKLVEKAKEIEENLKWTRRIKHTDEFIRVWLWDSEVIEYRKLLREIWAFKTDVSIVSEKICCDETDCQETEGLLETRNYFTFDAEHYPFYETLCRKHFEKKKEFWEDRRIYEIVGEVK